MKMRWPAVVAGLAVGLVVARLVVPWWYGREAAAWYDGDADAQWRLATTRVAFEGERRGTARTRWRASVLIGVPLVIGYRATACFIPWITTRLRAR